MRENIDVETSRNARDAKRDRLQRTAFACLVYPAGVAARRPIPGDLDSQLETLEHAHRDAIVRVTELIRGADPRVRAGIKWGAPSFSITEHFATFQLRARRGIMLVMHFGAKKRTDLPPRDAIADPSGMLTWLADDRAVIGFADLADVEQKKDDFVALVRAWIAAQPS